MSELQNNPAHYAIERIHARQAELKEDLEQGFADPFFGLSAYYWGFVLIMTSALGTRNEKIVGAEIAGGLLVLLLYFYRKNGMEFEKKKNQVLIDILDSLNTYAYRQYSGEKKASIVCDAIQTFQKKAVGASCVNDILLAIKCAYHLDDAKPVVEALNVTAVHTEMLYP